MATEPCCLREHIAFNLYSRLKEPKLFRLASGLEWSRIEARAKSHPKEAVFRHKYPPYDTSLHRLLRPTHPFVTNDGVDDEGEDNESRLKATQAVILANRQACILQDAFGRTPLHLASMNLHKFGPIVALLLDSSPHAASVLDVERRTPLHFCLSRHREGQLDVSVLRLLLKHYPRALDEKDATGDTPVDIFRRHKSSFENADEVSAILSNK